MPGNVQYRLHSGVIAQFLGDELVIVHPETDRIFVLNRTAACIWELLSQHVQLDQIEEKLLEEFDVKPVHLGKELRALISSLAEQKFISMVGR